MTVTPESTDTIDSSSSDAGYNPNASSTAKAAADAATDTIEEMSHAAKVQKTQDQMNAIAEAIQQSQALTSTPLPIESLLPQYIETNNQYFLLGIDYLTKQYQYLRTTRGDGNCFYRAVWYQLCDMLLNDKDGEGQRLLKFVKEDSMKLATTQGGYDELALEIFYDAMVEFLETLVNGNLTQEQMHEQLTEEGGISEYCTWYSRALTATWCKAHADRFLPYLEEPFEDVAQFCASQIEPVGSEATMVAIVAFAECFRVTVSIEYLDGHAFDPAQGLTNHILGDVEASKLQLTLLYRPGHYDILYRKNK
ncbi:peptidase C26 family protein [Nitzschia inconspicua]|uniref:Peptidase C26 family protein n=1 Tax=Nitzschia inconspicua TaxID=303405 RepID=A0A9K3L6L7_9STRA|nr:peptidase C26 family protein [Nitzschia inconspicua]